MKYPQELADKINKDTMSRYKTHTFKSFVGGEGQELFDQPNKFYQSNNINVDLVKGTVKNAPALVSSTQTVPHYQLHLPIIKYSDNKYYSVIQDAIAPFAFYVMRSDDGLTSWAKVYKLYDNGGAGTGPTSFFSINNTLVVSNGDKTVWYYSTTPSTSWSSTAFSPVEGPDNPMLAYGNNKAYIVFDNSEVLTTSDGSSYQQIQSSTDSNIWSVAFYDGYLYGIMQSYFTTTVYLVRLDGNKWQKVKTINTSSPSLLCTYNDILLIISQHTPNVTISYYDGLSLNFIGTINNTTLHKANELYTLAIPTILDDKVYFTVADTASGQYLILSLNKELSLFKEFIIPLYSLPTYFSKNASSFLIQAYYYSGAGTNAYYLYSTSATTFYQSSSIITSKVNIGPHIPIGFQITFAPGIYHAPDDTYPFLTKNIRAAITFDDQATVTKDVADLTNNTALKFQTYAQGAATTASKMTCVEYKFSTVQGQLPFIYNQIQMTLTLESSSDYTSVPEIYSVKYIYEPVGLENAN